MPTDVDTLPLTGRIRLVCNSGNFMDAYVEVDGKVLTDVHRIEFVIQAGAVTEAVLHIDCAAIEVEMPMRRVTYEAIEE